MCGLVAGGHARLEVVGFVDLLLAGAAGARSVVGLLLRKSNSYRTGRFHRRALVTSGDFLLVCVQAMLDTATTKI